MKINIHLLLPNKSIRYLFTRRYALYLQAHADIFRNKEHLHENLSQKLITANAMYVIIYGVIGSPQVHNIIAA